MKDDQPEIIPYVPLTDEELEAFAFADPSSLAFWREKRGLELGALAASCGVPESDLTEIERGLRKPGEALLAVLAEALNVSLDDLTDRWGLNQPITPQGPPRGLLRPFDPPRMLTGLWLSERLQGEAYTDLYFLLAERVTKLGLVSEEELEHLEAEVIRQRSTDAELGDYSPVDLAEQARGAALRSLNHLCGYYRETRQGDEWLFAINAAWARARPGKPG